MKLKFLALALFGLSVPVFAHDTWVETNTPLYRVGDVAHIDLKLGNHGNNHRDFKLASKVALDGVKMEVVAPDGKRYDLKSSLTDTGYTPKEGFWTGGFTNAAPGLYCVHQTLDAVMTYAPERAIKSAKTYFMASKSLDRVPMAAPGFDKRLGDALEIVPENNPIAPIGAGMPLKLRLYFQGKPLAKTKISFIPEGETLRGDFDSRYEAITNINGRVTFTPTEAKRYLAVAHVETKEAGQNKAGEKYTFTQYGATLTVYIPAICPCCGG
ncbi:DUF4198 domain-containing protein [bacterium]|nr:MAG: DUF4198 domain-containing protein [bacterium]